MADNSTVENMDYPRRLYQADGRTMVVETLEEHEAATGEGWVMEPSEIHWKQPPTTYASTSDPTADLIRQIMNEVLDERGIGNKFRYTGPRR